MATSRRRGVSPFLRMAMASMLWALGGSAGAGQDAESPHRDEGSAPAEKVTLLVADEPYLGVLIPPATDSEFKFKLAETGDVVTFLWSALEESERKRVQKLFGIAVEEGCLVWGRRVRGVRFQLAGGKSALGLELSERALPGHRCLKTSSAVLQYPARLVERAEDVELSESEIYSATEYYQRALVERPPRDDSAQDHLELARLCSAIGYFEKGLEHLEMATLIEPRTVELVSAFRAEVARKWSEQLAEKLYLEIRMACWAEDFASAKEGVERFVRSFPSSEYRTRVERMRAEVDKGFQQAFAKQVVFMYYHLCPDLIRERMARKNRLDEKGRVVPVEPGKQVITTSGHVFRGLLLKDSDGQVLLKMGDTTLEMKRKEVYAMTDVDVSAAFATSDPGWAELKAYATGKDGLGKDLIRLIAARLKLREREVREIWENRFHCLATYDDGVLKKTPLYTTTHHARFGKGSWLSEGAQEHRPGQEEDPEASNDREIWWKAQTNETKLEVLHAFAAQKLFRVKDLVRTPCPECGGQGFQMLTPTNGSATQNVLCLTCHGLQYLIEFDYE